MKILSLPILKTITEIMDCHYFQGQSYAKEMALIGQITVELVFILGKVPENAPPC